MHPYPSLPEHPTPLALDNMDWTNENAFLAPNSPDLQRMFKYGPRSSRVVKITRKKNVCSCEVTENSLTDGMKFTPQVFSLQSHDDWETWLEEVSQVSVTSMMRMLTVSSARRLCRPGTFTRVSRKSLSYFGIRTNEHFPLDWRIEQTKNYHTRQRGLVLCL
jgi:hypothetical protein